jgi:bifunctional non-homologous end joining protein LigD
VSLSEYRKKRDPAQTPEPFGSGKSGAGLTFVVQRHDATRLHYDFRLERDGALASWAVPKGVPLEPGAKVHLRTLAQARLVITDNSRRHPRR